MRKYVILLVVLFVSFSVFGISFIDGKSVNDFDSDQMLQKHYGTTEKADDYWKDVHISLITMSRGKKLYSWFGHSAIMVEKPGLPALMYDWGRFSFGEDFWKNFIMGKLLYRCGVSYAESELAFVESEERGISKIELNLNPKQKKDIDDFLILNSSEGYNTYLYKFLDDNCSTRVRDIINKATEGRFELWAKTKSGSSYRQHIFEAMRYSIPLAWAYDFLERGSCDDKQSLWEEMFLPVNLEKGVRNFEDLALSQTQITNFQTEGKPVERTKGYLLTSLCIGLLLALVSASSYELFRGIYKIQIFLVDLIFGLLGTVLFFTVCFSEHDITYFNENLFFINPILLVAAILSFGLKRNRQILRKIYCLLCTLAAALIILKIGIPSVFRQNNWAQLLTVLPYYIANAVIFSKTEKGADNHQNAEKEEITEDIVENDVF